MDYWIGPLEVKRGRIAGYWERIDGSVDTFKPALGAPMKLFGDAIIGQYHRFKTSPENIVTFPPKYFSQRILTFLLARGACYDGALCWAQLPPAILAYQACVENKDAKKYPHEAKFFRLLQGKFPRAFVRSWQELRTRPPLGLLKHSASEWGL